MTEENFWELIAVLDWRKRPDDRAVVQPLIDALAALPIKEIKAFDGILAKKLYALDTVEHASNIGRESYTNSEEVFSADAFLYARLMTVAKGREFYERALTDPRKMPRNQEFEALLSAGWKAFETKSDKEYDRRSRVSFETFSNRKGWANAE